MLFSLKKQTLIHYFFTAKFCIRQFILRPQCLSINIKTVIDLFILDMFKVTFNTFFNMGKYAGN